jgi:hypothetical protein
MHLKFLNLATFSRFQEVNLWFDLQKLIIQKVNPLELLIF